MEITLRMIREYRVGKSIQLPSGCRKCRRIASSNSKDLRPGSRISGLQVLERKYRNASSKKSSELEKSLIINRSNSVKHVRITMQSEAKKMTTVTKQLHKPSSNTNEEPAYVRSRKQPVWHIMVLTFFTLTLYV